jgi:D-arabinose 1-dehydrogenase-like Zn-dependent alcohol dehydrogenase
MEGLSFLLVSRSNYIVLGLDSPEIAVGDVPINTVPLVIKGLEVTGWPTGATIDCEEAIAFAENKGIKCLIDKFPLSKALEAFEHSMSGKSRFRTVLVME